METANLVMVQEYCRLTNVDITFIESITELGLVEIVSAGEDRYIPHAQLPELEKLIHFHYELNINIEGLDVIQNLLHQIEELQKELRKKKAAF